MENEIFIFDFEFDESKLLETWERYKDSAIPYQDKRMRGSLSNWKIARDVQSDYIDHLNSLFSIESKPRFTIQEKGSMLPMHTDLGTECSINILLSTSNPSPVTFEESGNTYYYKTALLNTSLRHGVNNVNEERLLFKMSIFGETFEQVKEKIINAGIV